MNIFYFIGSLNSDSKGEFWTRQLMNCFEIGNNKNFLYLGRNVNLTTCEGCASCFLHGICPLDKKDNMKKIKEDMLQADVIVWVAPVYLSNISGTMKNYIDRICEWLHILKLSGKLGVIITVSEGKNYEYSEYYLETIMKSMGCKIVGAYNINDLTDFSQKKEQVNFIAKNIKIAFESEDQFKTCHEMEYLFRESKKFFLSHFLDQYEFQYWSKHLKKYETYQDFLNSIKAKR